MVWLTIPAHIIPLTPPRCLFLATGTSKLNKIHPFSYPPEPSNNPQDSSVKITLEKLIFMYFLAQFRCFRIFALVKGVCQIPTHKESYIFLDSFDFSLLKDLSACQK